MVPGAQPDSYVNALTVSPVVQQMLGGLPIFITQLLHVVVLIRNECV